MTGRVSDMTDFLLARIAEDEAFARGAASAAQPPWEVADRGWRASLYRDGSDNRMIVLDQAETANSNPGDVLRLVERFDPARILAECEAKRRIVELGTYWRDGVEFDGNEILRLLALPYASHPDFREEWRA